MAIHPQKREQQTAASAASTKLSMSVRNDQPVEPRRTAKLPDQAWKTYVASRLRTFASGR